MSIIHCARNAGDIERYFYVISIIHFRRPVAILPIVLVVDLHIQILESLAASVDLLGVDVYQYLVISRCLDRCLLEKPLSRVRVIIII